MTRTALLTPSKKCSAFGLAHIDEWLGDGKWDIIYFNWGIWDTHLLDSTGGLITNEDGYIGTAGITFESYGRVVTIS